MNVKKRTSLVVSLLCGALLVTVATVGAATIKGTAGNDTLRGGAAADKLDGKGGNDKLYGAAGNDALVGGPGNDLLVGGAGADRLACGAGRDTARGDANDKIAKDCEVVTGVPKPSPPAPPAPPPPPPPPPPAPKALPGIYCGNTVQGPPLCLTTNADGSAVANARTSSIVDCTTPFAVRLTLTIGFTTATPLQSDLSFAFNYTGPLTSGSTAITNIETTYFIRGTFTADGKASGQLAISSLAFDFAGQRFQCTQNPVDWTVTKQG